MINTNRNTDKNILEKIVIRLNWGDKNLNSKKLFKKYSEGFTPSYCDAEDIYYDSDPDTQPDLNFFIGIYHKPVSIDEDHQLIGVYDNLMFEIGTDDEDKPILVCNANLYAGDISSEKDDKNWREMWEEDDSMFGDEAVYKDANKEFLNEIDFREKDFRNQIINYLGKRIIEDHSNYFKKNPEILKEFKNTVSKLVESKNLTKDYFEFNFSKEKTVNKEEDKKHSIRR